MTDPLATAALERFRAACDDGARDDHPDVSVPRKHRRDYTHLAPWLDAAERWAWRRERRR